MKKFEVSYGTAFSREVEAKSENEVWNKLDMMFGRVDGFIVREIKGTIKVSDLSAGYKLIPNNIVYDPHIDSLVNLETGEEIHTYNSLPLESNPTYRISIKRTDGGMSSYSVSKMLRLGRLASMR